LIHHSLLTPHLIWAILHFKKTLGGLKRERRKSSQNKKKKEYERKKKEIK